MTDDREKSEHDHAHNAERVEQLLAGIHEALRLIADILSEMVPDRRSR
jgi:hypothetical protein